jgi:RNA methyltransferase, TrmH family
LNITRRSHPLIKEIRELRDKPQANLLFLEGPHLVEEALKANLEIRTLVLSKALKPQNSDVADRAQKAAKETVTVPDDVFESISDVDQPQGLLAIASAKAWSWTDITTRHPAPVLIVEGVQNPGNLASILRTAEAAGAAGLITTQGTARLNSPKALRAAMGSSLRFPCLEHLEANEINDKVSHAGYRLYATGVNGTSTCWETNWTNACAVVLGQEGAGVSNQWTPFIHDTISIPMRGNVESLNVAAAAAVLLYEAFRQRSAAP